MSNIVELISQGEYDQAKKVLDESIVDKMKIVLSAAKKKLAAKTYPEKPTLRSIGGKKLKKLEIKPRMEEETDQIDEARVAIVAARIRNGQVQRRKKISTVPGLTMRGGKLTRMSPAERRRRKMGARRAKLKVRGKQAQILRKRKVSLAKRQRLGL